MNCCVFGTVSFDEGRDHSSCISVKLYWPIKGGGCFNSAIPVFYACQLVPTDRCDRGFLNLLLQ